MYTLKRPGFRGILRPYCSWKAHYARPPKTIVFGMGEGP